ncbi:MAG: class I lanthipeptide [Candidatus Aminicenantes bacterium]|nr:class I lanthipeptide [Candidatus Aminicenantes bacterium]
MKKQILTKKLFLEKETIAALNEKVMSTVKGGTAPGTPTKIVASCQGDSICGCTNSGGETLLAC